MKLNKLILSSLTFLILSFLICIPSLANEPNLKSEAAILFEVSTGNILYSKNATQKLYPASTTKILTAIIAIESCELDDVATVSKNAIALVPSGYSNGGLVPGEELTIKDLLYALMLNSANEAANVLAEHISGTIDKFSILMNQKADEIGCTNSNFLNTNGMHNDNHYTTALDLAIIANYCMKNDTFREIVSTQTYTLPNTNKYSGTPRIMKNTNQLINTSSKYYLEEATGIKTGYTSQAGNCLVSSAKRNNIELIAVTLKAGSSSQDSAYRFIDGKELLEYGLNNFNFRTIATKGDLIDTIKIENATTETENLKIVIKEDIIDFLANDSEIEETKIEIKENLEAPIKAGTVVGQVSYSTDDKFYTVELIAENEIIERTYYEIFIIIGIIILIFIIIILKIISSRKNKNYFRKNI